MADQGLRGVGGWLALLVIIMLVVTPLTVIWMTVTAATAPGARDLPGGTTLLWAVAIVQAGAFAYAGWRLNTVMRRSSVTLAIATWWLAGPVLTLAYAGIITALTGGGASVLPFALELARGVVVAGLWTAYLLRSRRVANSYATGKGLAGGAGAV